LFLLIELLLQPIFLAFAVLCPPRLLAVEFILEKTLPPVVGVVVGLFLSLVKKILDPFLLLGGDLLFVEQVLEPFLVVLLGEEVLDPAGLLLLEEHSLQPGVSSVAIDVDVTIVVSVIMVMVMVMMMVVMVVDVTSGIRFRLLVVDASNLDRCSLGGCGSGYGLFAVHACVVFVAHTDVTVD